MLKQYKLDGEAVVNIEKSLFMENTRTHRKLCENSRSIKMDIKIKKYIHLNKVTKRKYVKNHQMANEHFKQKIISYWLDHTLLIKVNTVLGRN